MLFVLKFELILIIGSTNVLTEGARKVYRGRRVGQGCSTMSTTAQVPTVAGCITDLNGHKRHLTEHQTVLKR
jgi:hypothetical protein